LTAFDVDFDFDVAVVGAGPAGSACALALAQAGVERVCLLDSADTSRRPRVAIGETIPPDTRLLLDRLRLWDAFVGEQHETCLGSCSSWGKAALGFNDFLLNPYGCGWHLDRPRFDDFLRRRAALANVTTLAATRATAITPTRLSGSELELETRHDTSRTLRARFVVDATGPASIIARHLDARQLPLDRLTFVYGFFDASGPRSRSRLTLLEAIPEGWWYAATVPGQRVAVALAADADRVRAENLTREDRWLGAIPATRHLARRLDGCRFIGGSMTIRVVSSFRLDHPAGHHWLAIGDAAAVFDPIAAQGIHKALADGIEGAELILAALAQNRCLGTQHEDHLNARFNEYLLNRNYFYDRERRWPDSLFWRRRQARRALSDGLMPRYADNLASDQAG
jgi:flavin-dependent dehydrogenase